MQYGPGDLKMRGRDWSLFLQDDWRVRGNLTINYGLRYEYVSPYYEANNNLVNLDVNSDFTAAVPVVAGGTGQFTGPVPTSLVEADRNNVAPRVGLAWRARPGMTVRAGYGVNYNLGAYGSIAQKLAAQPPFAVTSTSLGTAFVPLLVVDPFASVDSSTTTNSFGIDRTYDLGVAQIWNGDVQKDLPETSPSAWATPGRRARTSTFSGRRIATRTAACASMDVQPFLWQSSEGRSTLHALTVRARKRPSRGISFGGAYVWSRAYDNASSFGGGGGTVAQNDQDLEAEWGRSTFERRHAVNADYTIELPWGTGRPLAQQHQPAGPGLWRLELERDLCGPIRRSLHPARDRQLRRRRVGRQRDAARRLQRQRHLPERSDDDALLQHRCLHDPGIGHVRERLPQPDHRAWVAQPEHEPVEERQLRTHAWREHPSPGEQRPQHGAVLLDRHPGQLADVRPGDGGPPDAIRAADSPFQILIMLNPARTRGRLAREREIVRVLSIVALATCLTGVTAPSAWQSVQRRPTFRAGVELIYVNVVVRDGSGNIVRNLKREDFTLVEDDKTQAITAFDFEEVPSEAIVAAEAEPVQPILKAETAPKPPPTVSRRGARGGAQAGVDRPQESTPDCVAVRLELDAARGARARHRRRATTTSASG